MCTVAVESVGADFWLGILLYTVRQDLAKAFLFIHQGLAKLDQAGISSFLDVMICYLGVARSGVISVRPLEVRSASKGRS